MSKYNDIQTNMANIKSDTEGYYNQIQKLKLELIESNRIQSMYKRKLNACRAKESILHTKSNSLSRRNRTLYNKVLELNRSDEDKTESLRVEINELKSTINDFKQILTKMTFTDLHNGLKGTKAPYNSGSTVELK